MVAILELIFNFKIFDTVYATTQGGPASASQTVIMLLYDTAFKYFRLGDASVMAVFVFLCLLAVTLGQWALFRRQVEYRPPGVAGAGGGPWPPAAPAAPFPSPSRSSR